MLERHAADGERLRASHGLDRLDPVCRARRYFAHQTNALFGHVRPRALRWASGFVIRCSRSLCLRRHDEVKPRKTTRGTLSTRTVDLLRTMEVLVRHAQAPSGASDTISPGNQSLLGADNSPRDAPRVVSDVSILCPAAVDHLGNRTWDWMIHSL